MKVSLNLFCDFFHITVVPIGHTMYVVHYFDAGAWGGSGNVALFAVDVNDDATNAAFTYYCAVSSLKNLTFCFDFISVDFGLISFLRFN